MGYIRQKDIWPDGEIVLKETSKTKRKAEKESPKIMKLRRLMRINVSNSQIGCKLKYL